MPPVHAELPHQRSTGGSWSVPVRIRGFRSRPQGQTLPADVEAFENADGRCADRTSGHSGSAVQRQRMPARPADFHETQWSGATVGKTGVAIGAVRGRYQDRIPPTLRASVSRNPSGSGGTPWCRLTASAAARREAKSKNGGLDVGARRTATTLNSRAAERASISVRIVPELALPLGIAQRCLRIGGGAHQHREISTT